LLPNFDTTATIANPQDNITSFTKHNDNNFATSVSTDTVPHGVNLSLKDGHVVNATAFEDAVRSALNGILDIPITSVEASSNTLKGKIWRWYTTGTASSTPSSITMSHSGDNSVSSYVPSLAAGTFFNPANNPADLSLNNGDTILVPISLPAANGVLTKKIYYGFSIVE